MLLWIYGITPSNDVKKKLFILWCFAFLPSFGQCLQLSDLRTAVRLRVKDTSVARQRFSDLELNALLNEAQRDVENHALVTQSTTTFTLTANTSFYSMPADFLEFYRVTYSPLTGTGSVLQETSLFQLDGQFDNIDWKNTTGIPTSYYQDPASPVNFFLYPIPSTTTQLGTLFVNYFSKDLTMVNDSDLPFNSIARYQDFSDALVYYASAIIYQLEGESDKAKAYMDVYQMMLGNMIKIIGEHPNYLPQFSGPSKSR